MLFPKNGDPTEWDLRAFNRLYPKNIFEFYMQSDAISWILSAYDINFFKF